MYGIQDNQGGGLRKDEQYATLDEVRASLESFHSIDVEGTDKMTLIELCEIGDWSVTKDGEVIDL